jgi:hypothetical protein
LAFLSFETSPPSQDFGSCGWAAVSDWHILGTKVAAVNQQVWLEALVFGDSCLISVILQA